MTGRRADDVRAGGSPDDAREDASDTANGGPPTNDEAAVDDLAADGVVLEELRRAFDRPEPALGGPPTAAPDWPVDATVRHPDLQRAIFSPPPAENGSGSGDTARTRRWRRRGRRRREPATEEDLEVRPAAEEHAGSTDDSRSLITISDDDLPDPVYIDGQLDPGRSVSRSAYGDDGGTAYVIEDDHGGDTISVVAGSLTGAVSIDPKFRDRRIAVRRALGRRRLRWLGAALTVLVVVIATLAVLGSPLFSISGDRVRVVGAVYTDPDALQRVVDDLVGTPTLIADTTAAEQQLAQIPWVRSARVRTDFPSGLIIEVDEREALATYRGPDGRFRVIDRDGRVLDVIDGQPVAYVLVNVSGAVNLAPGQFTGAGPAAAAELVQALTAAVRQRVLEIDVAADGSNLTLVLDGDVTVEFGEARDLLVKLVRLEATLPVAAERGAQVVDVSTAEVSLR